MLLSNVLIASGGEADRALPPAVEENVDTFKALHPDLEYRLFLEEDVLELLKDKFTDPVQQAYQSLKPFAYRADLARYCILFEYGGLYADLSYYFVRPVPMPKNIPVVFRGNLVSAPWDTSNGIIYMPPRHKALAQAIKMVCANVQRRYFGATALCPTGPALFGKALATTCEAEEIITGRASLTKREQVQHLVPHMVLPGDDHIHCQSLKEGLVAVKRKPLASTGLGELGITTGNAYREMWEKRQVYG